MRVDAATFRRAVASMPARPPQRPGAVAHERAFLAPFLSANRAPLDSATCSLTAPFCPPALRFRPLFIGSICCSWLGFPLLLVFLSSWFSSCLPPRRRARSTRRAPGPDLRRSLGLGGYRFRPTSGLGRCSPLTVRSASREYSSLLDVPDAFSMRRHRRSKLGTRPPWTMPCPRRHVSRLQSRFGMPTFRNPTAPHETSCETPLFHSRGLMELFASSVRLESPWPLSVRQSFLAPLRRCVGGALELGGPLGASFFPRITYLNPREPVFLAPPHSRSLLLSPRLTSLLFPLACRCARPERSRAVTHAAASAPTFVPFAIISAPSPPAAIDAKQLSAPTSKETNRIAPLSCPRCILSSSAAVPRFPPCYARNPLVLSATSHVKVPQTRRPAARSVGVVVSRGLSCVCPGVSPVVCL